jgi:hypothetical protein
MAFILLILFAPAPPPKAPPSPQSGQAVLKWNGGEYALTLCFRTGSYRASNADGDWIGTQRWDGKDRTWHVTETLYRKDGTVGQTLHWWSHLDDALAGQTQGGVSARIGIARGKP